MSHIITSKLTIKDINILEQAAKKFGLVLNRNKKTYRTIYHKGYSKCAHALSLEKAPKACEIGVVENQDGNGYHLRLEADDSRLLRAIDYDLKNLEAAYVEKMLENEKIRNPRIRDIKSQRNSNGEYVFRVTYS